MHIHKAARSLNKIIFIFNFATTKQKQNQMKAKYLLLVLGIFCCMSIKAIEEDIPLYRTSDSKGNWDKDKRSITLIPTATIDGNTIRIYSDVTISGLQTSIKDSMGNIVYSYNDMTSSRCHTFEVYSLYEGEYTLELKIGEDSFYGNFIFD
ncbi:DUF3244 domain-containing protein [uncultured Bacteroides sp.]|jgi:hypothetical protein|nr:DUF3244 domain-containing protein [uncultured Bacteroides sp.]